MRGRDPMTQKSPRLRAIFGALFIGGAVALPLMFYAAHHPTLGAALLLSGVLVFAIAFVRSGALATSWLAGETRGTIGNATRYELAKALTCAALAVDALFGGMRVLYRYRLWADGVTVTLVLTATGLLAIGAGLFVTRWFAGYLFTRW
jgi:hypothetical protein